MNLYLQYLERKPFPKRRGCPHFALSIDYRVVETFLEHSYVNFDRLSSPSTFWE